MYINLYIKLYINFLLIIPFFVRAWFSLEITFFSFYMQP